MKNVSVPKKSPLTNSCLVTVGTLQASDIASGAAEIEINGQPVVGLTDIHLCHFLRGEQGHYWPLSAESRFEIRARVTQSQSSLRFGSFVVW